MSKKRHAQKRHDQQLQPDDGIVVRSYAIRHTSPCSISDHAHDWHQLIYASEGVMWVHTAQGEWVVPPNRAVWVPANMVHGIEISGKVLMQTIYIHPSVKAELPAKCCAVNISPLLRELILHTIALGPLDRSNPLKARLLAFLLDQLHVLPAIALQLPRLTDVRAQKVVAWMRAHPEDNGSIKNFARKASIGIRTLERIFHRETGMTLGKWRMQLRMLQALRLIAEHRSITQVAMAVGYDSTSAFIAAFKRVFETTPGKYFKQPGAWIIEN